MPRERKHDASTSPTFEVPDDHPWPIVLGIDPGTVAVGYGAIVAHREGPAMLAAGVIRARRGDDVPARLATIRRGIDDLLQRLKPSVVAIEQAFAGENIATALRIGEGRGVALAAAACFGAKVVQFAPAVAKRALVGNGAADKSQVAAMVAAELGLDEPPSSLDATDALALALTYVHHSRLTMWTL